MTPEWRLPPSTEELLAESPRDRPVVVLLRHSVRGPLPDGEAGNQVPILPIGEQLARQLGARMGARLASAHASPLPRCVQTAEALVAGAAAELPIHPNQLLGGPGVFVLDGELAWQNWQQWGHEGVMERLVGVDEPMPGMGEPEPAARWLVDQMFAIAGDQPGLHVFVTHDSLVTATVARLLGVSMAMPDWPWYLEAAWFWRDDGRQVVRYREHESSSQPAPLSSLCHDDVIAFARRQVAETIGLASSARFFLAGGAFRSLLTLEPPHDLDLWPASEDDRRRMITTLRGRGAAEVGMTPFADSFRIAGRVVEVVRKVSPPDLAGRLARFDLGLAAVGVEHQSDSGWTVQIHPRALESVERREILALLPLANPRFALTTLERARRYARELGFSVAAETEEAVWAVFDTATDAEQTEMTANFLATTRGGFGVLHEVQKRRPR